MVCPWNDYKCNVCKQANMRFFTCHQGPNKGKNFLRCEQQPKCNNFISISDIKDDAKAVLERNDDTDDKVVLELNDDNKDQEGRNDANKDQEGRNVKLTVNGKMQMVFEGDVEDVCVIVKKLWLN